MTLPESVRTFVRDVFADCNLKVSNRLSKQPATWETHLDLSLVDHLANYSAPIKIEKNWIVRFDTHYLGGVRHWDRWEIADIGVLIIFRRKGKVVKSKIALLQSKKLYSNEAPLEEATREHYIIGFGRLYETEEMFEKIIQPRIIQFTEGAMYEALSVKDEQWEAIGQFQRRTTVPVHYLFYNPCQVPHSIEMPLTDNIEYTSFSVGTRVLPADVLHKRFDSEKKGYHPSYGELKYTLDSPFNDPGNQAGWRLEDFMADQLITCREGYIVNGEEDFNLSQVFYRRSGPIAAAFSITFDVSED